MEEIKGLFNKTSNVIDSSDFSKEDIDCIKSSIDEIKKMEESKLQFYAKDLAKKIREYSENN